MAEATISSDKNSENVQNIENVQESTENVQIDDPRISNWTKEEKVELYQAVKRYGSENTTLIAEQLFNKSEDDVKAAFQFYEEQASKVLGLPVVQCTSKRQLNILNTQRSKPSNIPLANWATFLTDSHEYEKLQTEIYTALRLIGYFDKKSASVTNSKIDISKVYHMLADATEGRTIQGDESIKVLLEKCITESALTSKAFINPLSYKQALQNIDMTEKIANTFTKPDGDLEMNIMRHLIFTENYNPLNIAEDYVKPSK